MKIETLEKVAKGQLRPRAAYRALYKRRRAHCYKIRFTMREAKHASRFLNILFFLPTPVFILKAVFRIAFKDLDKATRKLISGSLRIYGTNIAVYTDEVSLTIKAI